MTAPFSPRTPLAIKRGNRRKRVAEPALLLTAGGQVPAKLRDLSRSGALAEAARPPLRGTMVVLSFGSCAVPAIVAWVIGRRCGLEFEQLIAEEQVAAFRSGRLC